MNDSEIPGWAPSKTQRDGASEPAVIPLFDPYARICVMLDDLAGRLALLEPVPASVPYPAKRLGQVIHFEPRSSASSNDLADVDELLAIVREEVRLASSEDCRHE